jgi:D-2-hydroxyacid dehydrogenase (NADP+)
MKFVFHRGRRPIDTTPLRKQFPDLTFVNTHNEDDLEQHVSDVEVLVVGNTHYTPETSALLRAKARNLRWIQFTTSGLDVALKAGGFPPQAIVTNSAGLRAPNVSEHVFALLLFLTRRLRESEQGRAEKKWLQEELFNKCDTLYRKTMLVIGMGAIGQAVARKARAFGMTVEAISRAYAPDGDVSKVYARDEAAQAFAKADVVVLSLQSKSDTQGFVSKNLIAAMKPTSYLINIARGAVINEEALIEACANRKIAGAGLDVMVTEPLPPSSPLWTLDNVVIAPHTGGGGGDDTDVLLEMIAENIALYVAGKPLKRVVEL